MKFEYCRRRAMYCRERVAQKSDLRRRHARRASVSTLLRGSSGAQRPPSRVDALAPSGEAIKYMSAAFTPEAMA
jgi:hypothetical protein